MTNQTPPNFRTLDLTPTSLNAPLRTVWSLAPVNTSYSDHAIGQVPIPTVLSWILSATENSFSHKSFNGRVAPLQKNFPLLKCNMLPIRNLLLFSKRGRRLKTSFPETILKIFKDSHEAHVSILPSCLQSFSALSNTAVPCSYLKFSIYPAGLMILSSNSQPIFYLLCPTSCPRRLTSMHFIIQAPFSSPGVPAGQK